MNLNELRDNPGARLKSKRLGRGIGGASVCPLEPESPEDGQRDRSGAAPQIRSQLEQT